MRVCAPHTLAPVVLVASACLIGLRQAFVNPASSFTSRAAHQSKKATGRPLLSAHHAEASGKPKSKPSLDYPPPAASLAWPRYLAWAAATYTVLAGFRRKLLGGAQAVALDPALPNAVRLELIKSRKDLRSKSQTAPRSFRTILAESADTLEEVPALLVTVAVLAGDALRKRGTSLRPYRRLGEAQALLFTAGRLHLNMRKTDNKTMRLLGGDFLYAEGQWIMAELGSLPSIKLTARMIREVSDGQSEGGPAGKPGASGKASQSGLESALSAAYIRTGAYFATVASGAAWLSGADKETLEALRRYGADLGCAVKFAQYRGDAASQDVALWLARSAGNALQRLQSSTSPAAVRGLKRLAHRVERACARELERILQQSSQPITGYCFGDLDAAQAHLDSVYWPADAGLMVQPKEEDAVMSSGLGFSRDEASDRALNELIGAGLDSTPLVKAPMPAPPWPEEGPKAALEGALRCVGRQLMEVNGILDGSGLSAPAASSLVVESVQELFRSGGKRLRPALTLLVAQALGAQEERLSRVAALAASIEVLHSASLVHDDILDAAEFRRGKRTMHMRLGERAATLVGDFLFATASVMVAELGNLPVVVLISKVVADFGRGELAQSAVRFEAVDYSLEDYLAKSFYKTASLLAAACHSAAVLSGVAPESAEARSCYKFGAYVGLAFQVVDDILDFTSTEEELGKPALADLKEGNLSAPVLFAAQEHQTCSGIGEFGLEPEGRRELLALLDRRLSEEEDLERTKVLVGEANGVARAKALARRFIDLAALELEELPDSGARGGLRTFAEFVIARSY